MPAIRAAILDGLEELGLRLDRSRNEKQLEGDGPISAGDSRIEAWALATDEESVIARDAIALLRETLRRRIPASFPAVGAGVRGGGPRPRHLWCRRAERGAIGRGGEVDVGYDAVAVDPVSPGGDRERGTARGCRAM